MKKLRTFVILPVITAACFAAAGCVPRPPQPAPPPAGQPAPQPSRAPAALPPAGAPPANWMDAPATPGDWSYRTTSGGSQAVFGELGSEARLTLQCSRTAGQVLLVRAGEARGPVPMRILTETENRVLTASPDRGDVPAIVASLSARDPLLDAMAISKGRFAVETTGLPTIYAPSWPEVSRVVEDCR